MQTVPDTGQSGDRPVSEFEPVIYVRTYVVCRTCAEQSPQGTSEIVILAARRFATRNLANIWMAEHQTKTGGCNFKVWTE